MAGDTVTMDLVKDLQKRLDELETQIKSPADNTIPSHRRSKGRGTGQGDRFSPLSEADGGQKSRKQTGSQSKDFEELKQERRQHRSELRQLQTELSRIRHNDPIRSVEISFMDLDYDESGKGV